MKIIYILPGFSRTPIGGYKMVYEYANRLDNLGHEVTVVSLNNNKMKQFHMPECLRKVAVNIENRKEPKWFKLNSTVKKVSGEEKNYIKKIGECDVVIATGIQTVEVVKNNFLHAKKMYFIQGYENWDVSDEYLHQTYKYGFINVCVSKWLKEIVDKYSMTQSYLLKNPIDTDVYCALENQLNRKPHSIGLLYHTAEIKGVKYALEAIYKLKEIYSDLTVEMFGMFARPNELPEWVNYTRNASLQETVDIYNKVQVFLCATIEEGYGLTGLEAMACGACLVSTAYKGVMEYAENNFNALLSPVKDVDGLVSCVSQLFDCDKKRIQISQNGVESVKEYSWDNAVSQLEDLIS